MRVCAAPGCERRATSRGWCKRHYDRWLRTGSVEGQRDRASDADELLHLIGAGVGADEALARVGWTRVAARRWATRHRRAEVARAVRVRP